MIIITSSTDPTAIFTFFQLEKAVEKFKELGIVAPFHNAPNAELHHKAWEEYNQTGKFTSGDFTIDTRVIPVDEEEIQEKIYAKFQATAAISYAAGMLLKKTPSKDDDIEQFITWGSEFDELYPAETFKSRPPEYYYAELGKFFDSKMGYFDKKE